MVIGSLEVYNGGGCFAVLIDIFVRTTLRFKPMTFGF